VLKSTRWRWALVALLVLPALAILGLRAFVGDLFLVDSGSMEPVLHGDPVEGDRVFVRYERRPALRRFDLVVLERPGERAPLVKRVVGLPGESIQLSGGDLYVGGRLLTEEERRAPWVPIFDTARHSLGDLFHFDRPRWSESEGVWRIDGRGARGVFARLRPRLQDDYLLPDGRRVEGRNPVNDAALELDVRLAESFGTLILRLSEEGDLFWAELSRGSEGHLRARLLRATRSSGGDTAPEVLGVSEFEYDPRDWLRVRFSNRDNDLALDLDLGPRTGALRHRYTRNSPTQRTPDGGMIHALPRIEFGGDDLALELRRVQVERDTTWFNLGRFATSEPEVLGPDELFVLGDNSAESRDSREWGPIPLDSLIGTPRSILWPRSRARDL
jgi:signal peptidase I